MNTFRQKTLYCSQSCAILLAFCLNLQVSAQENTIELERVVLGPGIAQGNIYAITQDEQGFMWFGTETGLRRYDGYEFVVYESVEDDPGSLAATNVNALLEDSKGTLWVGTWGGGLDRFNPASETFTHFRHDPLDATTLSQDRVNSLYEDSHGVLWVGTSDGGLNRFETGTATFTRFVHHPEDPGSISHNSIDAITEDREGTLWVGTVGGGLNRFDRDSETFVRYLDPTEAPGTRLSHRVRALFAGKDGSLWIGTRGSGISVLEPGSESVYHYFSNPSEPNSLVSSSILAITRDRSGKLWIGTRGGLNIFDPSNGELGVFVNRSRETSSANQNNFGVLFEDRAGTMWIGAGRTLFKYDPVKDVFRQYGHRTNRAPELSHHHVLSIVQDQTGLLWIGTLGGLNRLDRLTGETRSYLHDPAVPSSLGHNHVRSLYEDRDGDLWIGSLGGGLQRYDRRSNSFVRPIPVSGQGDSLSSNQIRAILQDRDGVLWVGTSRGLNAYHKSSGKVVQYHHQSQDSGSLSNPLVTSLFEDHLGFIWVGTRGGLSRFDKSTRQFKRYAYNPRDPRSLSSHNVAAIHEDQAGTIWVATYAGGLNRLDRSSDTFVRISKRDGLPDNRVHGFLEDDMGNLWLSTESGLARFHPSDRSIRTFDETDGLRSNQLNANANFRNSNTGEMFFGTINGYNVFNPDSIRQSSDIPPVVFTSFRRFSADSEGDQFIHERGISAKSKISVPYQDHLLRITFAALNYRNPARNRYAYRLGGHNNNWIQLGTTRDITLTGLSPGTYALHVKASIDDGAWNAESASLRITITPPWWLTGWAFAAYALLFALALVFLRENELKRERLRTELAMKSREAEHLREVDQLKTRFFAGVSHEFRTPLTLILGPVDKWLNIMQTPKMREDFAIVQRNARRLQQLINQLLDLSKLDAEEMQLQARPENIVALARTTTSTFSSLADEKKIELRIAAPVRDVTAYVEREKIETILTNLLGNAFKFTEAGGQVSVELTRTERDGRKTVEIRVSDTGSGIPADELDYIFDRFHQVAGRATEVGTGIGLTLTKELVELHHGTVEVASAVGEGTTFTLILPLGRDHLSDAEIGEEKTQPSPEPAAEAAPAPEAPNPQHDPQVPERGRRKLPLLLLVEDNADMRFYIEDAVQKRFRVITAKDGLMGWQKACDYAPDIILSDVMMPEMDGFALCEKLKTDARTSHIPVVLLTARSSEASKYEGLETGADDYVTKPFDARELNLRLRNLIVQRRKMQERFKVELAMKPADVTASSMDEIFLNRVMAAVREHLDDPDFQTDDLARAVGIGRRQLNRKLRALTGQSVRQFIRTVRLKQAARLLRDRSGTVTEIAYQVGFSSIAHFAKVFRRHFGTSPSSYSKNPSGPEQDKTKP